MPCATVVLSHLQPRASEPCVTDQPDLLPSAKPPEASSPPLRCGSGRISFCEAGLDGRLQHFTVDLGRLEPAPTRCRRRSASAYPSLDIPFHARWRHFDRRRASTAGTRSMPARPGGKAAPTWPAPPSTSPSSACCSTRAPARNGATRKAAPARPITRSEGLGVASFDMFVSGAFSSRPRIRSASMRMC